MRFPYGLPTLGGLQYWNDVQFRDDWRIQTHALIALSRLLTPSNHCVSLGSLKTCQLELDARIPDAIPRKRIVILLHGLARTSHCMESLRRSLEAESEWFPLMFGYASMQQSIERSAEAFDSFIASLPPAAELAFVGHSMGNIVVRRYLKMLAERGDQATHDRIQRVVMLGPPNQGSSIARRLSRTGVFGLVMGPGAMELGPRWERLDAKLQSPRCDFGIIAGVLPRWLPQNPLVDGAGDFVVSQRETQLEGAKAVEVIPRMHSFLMTDKRSQHLIANFLKTGEFQETNSERN